MHGCVREPGSGMLCKAQCPEARGTIEKLPKSCVECNSGPEAPGMHAGKATLERLDDQRTRRTGGVSGVAPTL